MSYLLHIFSANAPLDLSYIRTYSYHCNYQYDTIDSIVIHVTAWLLVDAPSVKLHMKVISDM